MAKKLLFRLKVTVYGYGFLRNTVVKWPRNCYLHCNLGLWLWFLERHSGQVAKKLLFRLKVTVYGYGFLRNTVVKWQRNCYLG